MSMRCSSRTWTMTTSTALTASSASVKVDTVYVPYVNEVVLVLELIQAELDGALSVSLIEASMDPGNWFRSRGVRRVVGVEESPDDGAPGTGGDDDPVRPEGPRTERKIDSELGDPNVQEATGMGSGIEVVASGYRVPIRDRSLNWALVPHVDPASRESWTGSRKSCGKDTWIVSGRACDFYAAGKRHAREERAGTPSRML